MFYKVSIVGLIRCGAEVWIFVTSADFEENRLYWFCASERSLRSVALNGGDRTTLLTDAHLSGLHSIVQHGDFVYWSQLTTQPALLTNIKKTWKFNRDVTGVIYVRSVVAALPVSEGITDVAVFGAGAQPGGASVCGQCARLCVPTPFTWDREAEFTCL